LKSFNLQSKAGFIKTAEKILKENISTGFCDQKNLPCERDYNRYFRKSLSGRSQTAERKQAHLKSIARFKFLFLIELS